MERVGGGAACTAAKVVVRQEMESLCLVLKDVSNAEGQYLAHTAHERNGTESSLTPLMER